MQHSPIPSRAIRLTGLCFALASLVGCTVNKAHWVADSLQSSENPIDWALIPSNEAEEDSEIVYDENLRIIEYDDQGDRWERQQVISATSLIANNSWRDPSPTVVVYVHGWRRNASREDQDLQGFNRMISNYNKAAVRDNRQKLIGIYIGWRGASVAEPDAIKPFMALPAYASYLERRPATDRMASIPLAHDLWQIRRAAKNNRVILVGHSFGGRIVERVVAHSILDYHVHRGSDPDPENRRERLMADLTLLINPASEALFARQMKLALGSWPKDEPPAIISVTSESDRANRTFWPLGKGIERYLIQVAGKQNRSYKLGHYENPASSRTEQQFSYMKTTAGFDDRLAALEVELRATDVRDHPNQNESGFAFEFIGVEEAPVSHRVNMDSHGYLVMRLDSAILDNHGGNEEEGIFSEEMIAFTKNLIQETEWEAYPNSLLYRKLEETFPDFAGRR